MKIKITANNGKSIKAYVTPDTYNKLVDMAQNFRIEIYQSNQFPTSGLNSVIGFLNTNVYFEKTTTLILK
jgi:hypothetical protein